MKPNTRISTQLPAWMNKAAIITLFLEIQSFSFTIDPYSHEIDLSKLAYIFDPFILLLMALSVGAVLICLALVENLPKYVFLLTLIAILYSYAAPTLSLWGKTPDAQDGLAIYWTIFIQVCVIFVLKSIRAVVAAWSSLKRRA